MVQMTGHGKYLYCIRDGALYRIDLKKFDRQRLSGDWEEVWAIASNRRRLYILQGNTLCEVNSDTGDRDDVILDDFDEWGKST
ncbi:MAG: hypothetical protein B6I35_03790 [Anaerolineaceae bacterium 4572_32.2]|nr:MAG: hypothetical protein B6I35_03790 [Anaerolineaceae bacterium 4572_32.2]HEY73050.1 hypothetical protein [Thermoflexia bacterium]